MRAESEDTKFGGPITEEFKDFLQGVVTTSFERRQPNPEAQRIAQIIVEGDLDKLKRSDVKRDMGRVFADAGLHFKRTLIEIEPR